MIGKQSSPVSLSYGICLTLLLVSSLVDISSSVPLIERNVRPLHLDDIGAFFRIVVQKIEIEGTNLSMEVSDENIFPLS